MLWKRKADKRVRFIAHLSGHLPPRTIYLDEQSNTLICKK